MSRIGKKPIAIPDKVQVKIDGNQVTCSGPKGTLQYSFHPDISFIQENNQLVVTRPSDTKLHRSLHGTSRAILANMVQGVSEGFTKELEIRGMGYSVNVEGKMLKLALGFSHDIYFEPPDEIEIKAKRNAISISGIDKHLVGQVAAKIRMFRPPESYKGKGIRYKDEYVKIKKGKTVGG